MMKSLEVVVDEGMIQNSEKMGNLLTQKLKNALGSLEYIEEIRNKGLFIGVELKKELNLDIKYFVYGLL